MTPLRPLKQIYEVYKIRGKIMELLYQGAYSLLGPHVRVQEGIIFEINPRGPRGSIFPEERKAEPERGPKAWVDPANLARRKKRKNPEGVMRARSSPHQSQRKEEKHNAERGPDNQASKMTQQRAEKKGHLFG